MKVRTFCDEVLETSGMKIYLNEIVRTNPQQVTIKNIVTFLKSYNMEHLDLD